MYIADHFFDELVRKGECKMRRIVVVPHENHWNEKFQIEAERLKSAMPEMVKVHHIGSTSVPGLAAKPIIDMIMEVESIDRVDHWNERFIELGYIVKGENGISRRRYFIHGTEEKRSYHLHVFEKGNPEIVRHLAFRDYMMARYIRKGKLNLYVMLMKKRKNGKKEI